MQKKNILAIVIAIVLAVLFFPVPITHNFSGDGDILSRQKEKIGTCILDIEIKEVSSLAICYKRSFSFSIDGGSVKEIENPAHSEADETCLLSSMHYDKAMDEMRPCGLVYKTDLSYAIIVLESNYYYINNGADIPYAELPIS